MRLVLNTSAAANLVLRTDHATALIEEKLSNGR
jgi:hypothetical protein